MGNRTSLRKARYCRSMMTMAMTSPDDEGRKLVYSLATETPTACTSAEVAQLEREAIDALGVLALRVQDNRISAVPNEWARAQKAVLKWISAAG